MRYQPRPLIVDWLLFIFVLIPGAVLFFIYIGCVFVWEWLTDTKGA